MPYAAR